MTKYEKILKEKISRMYRVIRQPNAVYFGKNNKKELMEFFDSIPMNKEICINIYIEE